MHMHELGNRVPVPDSQRLHYYSLLYYQYHQYHQYHKYYH
jgi:hypothetical protein